jgi:hypothetical protein
LGEGLATPHRKKKGHGILYGALELAANDHTMLKTPRAVGISFGA